MTKAMVWGGVALAVIVRFAFASLGAQLYLSRRVEIATPVTSPMRLAEGQWLKKMGLSPYAGSAYHGSPLLLGLLGPLTTQGSGQPTLEFLSRCSLLLPKWMISGLDIDDLVGALLLNAMGALIQTSHEHYMTLLQVDPTLVGQATYSSKNSATSSNLERETESKKSPAKLGLGAVAALLYLLNPFTIAVCVGRTTSPFENMLVIMSLYGAIEGNTPLAAFGWAISTHLSMTYGFILTVEDLSPNLGLFWYFFTEVFTHFRSFFIMVFHANILFVILPITIRFHHRPLFLGFVMVAITTLLKSYPSAGDAALTLSLMSLCTLELSGFRFSFLIVYGYLIVSILSPSMYNLWIWRGTGNANFYFAMALVYASLQSILIVESVGSVIRFDRSLKTAVEKQHTRVVDEPLKTEISG